MANKHVLTPAQGAISANTAVIAAQGAGTAIVIKSYKVERTDVSNTTTVTLTDGTDDWDKHILYAQGASFAHYCEDGSEIILPENTALTIETDFGIEYTIHYWVRPA